MTPTDKTDDPTLEAHFAAARDVHPAPSDDLVARVLAEADAIRMERLATRQTAPGLWAQLTAVLGGWRGLGGFAATVLAGVWLGYMPPALVDQAVGGALGTSETVSLWPDSTAQLEELFADG